METLLGNKSDFAIQAMTEPELKPPSAVWGRMCLWVQNTKLGDYNNAHCGLSQCVHHLNEVVELIDQLWDDKFTNKSNKEIFNLLKKAWHEPGFDDFGVPNGYEQYHKYNISYGFAEMFDSEGMFFLLNMPNVSLKLLYQPKGASEIFDFIINKESFISTINKFNSWYVQQENMLAGKND